MRENVLSAKMAHKFGLLQHPGGLLARPAEEKSASRFSEPVGKDFERMESWDNSNTNVWFIPLSSLL